MNYLEQYYSNYDEEARLLSRNGQVEYLTTMKYIHEFSNASRDFKILEVGAGTGRYSVALAKEGYSVDALEFTKHNLEIMNTKIDNLDNIRTYQGTATDLSRFEDHKFDMVLLLGPMYHLYTKEDKQKALHEATRVTKHGGVLIVAYILSDFYTINYAFKQGNLWEFKKKNLLDDNFSFAQLPEELFVFETIESIAKLEEDLNVERIKFVAAEGATNYMRDTVNQFDDQTFAEWMKYHFMTCERQDLIGATNHLLSISKKL